MDIGGLFDTCTLGGEGVCVDIGGLFDAQVTPGPPMTKETVRPFSLKEKTKNTQESKKKKKLPLKKKDPSKQGRVRVLRKVTTRLSDCDGSKECVTMVTGSEEVRKYCIGQPMTLYMSTTPSVHLYSRPHPVFTCTVDHTQCSLVHLATPM